MQLKIRPPQALSPMFWWLMVEGEYWDVGSLEFRVWSLEFGFWSYWIKVGINEVQDVIEHREALKSR